MRVSKTPEEGSIPSTPANFYYGKVYRMKTQNENFNAMKNEESYSFDSFLYHEQAKCEKLLLKINTLPFTSKRRYRIMKRLFASFGEQNVVKAGFRCNFGFNISIGSNCYFNHNVTILDSYEVEIGNNVLISSNVVISPVDHFLSAKERKILHGKKIVIEDNVWIGANSVILPGVTIHKNSVIGACSVVKSDVPPNTVVGGIPAKFIKNIDNEN